MTNMRDKIATILENADCDYDDDEVTLLIDCKSTADQILAILPDYDIKDGDVVCHMNLASARSVLIEQKARIDTLTEALRLADAMLSGANMDRSAVERKVTAALKEETNDK